MVADNAKVCLVTGLSHKLGKAIALELGKAGQKVTIKFASDGSKDGAEAAVAKIKALGGDAVAVQADGE
jgi:NAD(P)-dependent dehydrogenase (short-subunit alcohol dehydrogenase family)